MKFNSQVRILKNDCALIDADLAMAFTTLLNTR